MMFWDDNSTTLVFKQQRITPKPRTSIWISSIFSKFEDTLFKNTYSHFLISTTKFHFALALGEPPTTHATFLVDPLQATINVNMTLTFISISLKNIKVFMLKFAINHFYTKLNQFVEFRFQWIIFIFCQFYWSSVFFIEFVNLLEQQ